MPAQVMLARTPRERRRVLAFVRRRAARLYEGSTPPPSEILLYVEMSGRICGTIALDFVGPSGKLPLESIYRIDYERTPWRFDRREIAQFGKWWATRPGVAVNLMQIAHQYAFAEGKRLGLAEAKLPIVRRVEEFGMLLVKVPGAVLPSSGELSRSKGYYATLPSPHLYMFDIRSSALALGRHIKIRDKA